ncbi:MAG: hypothetical protein OHK0039_47650 [Bacteroidia bacterium]
MKLFIPLLLCASLGACCPPCDKPDLGDFYLRQQTGTWTDVLSSGGHFFEDENGNQVLLSYAPPETGFEEVLSDCDIDDRCGTCCVSYRSAYVYTRLESPGAPYAFDIWFQKDFATRDPLRDSTDIGDMLVITFNNRLTCTLNGLPDTLLARNVTLNGRVFTRVFAHEIFSPNLSPTEPAAIYYTRAEGLVGFALNNGQTWSLMP